MAGGKGGTPTEEQRAVAERLRTLEQDPELGDHPLMAELWWLYDLYAKENRKVHRISRIGDLIPGQAEDRKAQAEAVSQAKSDFLAMMGHELRSPLNTILGFTHLLQREHPHHEGPLGSIEHSARHLLGLIEDMLDLSAMEQGRFRLAPQAFYFHAFLEDIAGYGVLRARETGVAFRRAIPEPATLPHVVNGDDARLRQILLNLLGNAFRYTDAGRVTLEVRVEAEERVRFDVVDTGPGIPKANRERIFQAFERGEGGSRRDKGIGLGLAIASQLATRMGGQLDLASEPGRGTRVTLQTPLPPAAEDQVRQEMKVDQVLVHEGDPRHVLVVDDVAEHRLLLRELLETAGLTVSEAGSGAEALAQGTASPPDLILLDEHMPGMRGGEVFAALRQDPATASVPVFLVTAGGLEVAVEEPDFDAVLTKPVNADHLLGLLAEHLGLIWRGPDEEGETLPIDMTDPPSEAAALAAAPGEAERAALAELADGGRISAILQWTRDQEARDPATAPFAERVRYLAGRMDDKAILALARSRD